MSSRFRFFDLAGKTLLITGATRGIGKSLLPEFLEQGMQLIVVSRGVDRMESIRRSLGVQENRMQLFECDLSDPKAVAATGKAILDSGQPLDAVLHNAAIDPRADFRSGDEAFWNQVFQVNLFAAVSLTRALLPRLLESSHGRILFTGSILSDLGGAFLTAYSSSKGALVALTGALAHELRSTPITVNCVIPGAILVEKENASPEVDQQLMDWQSVSRRLVPSDLSGLIGLLLSESGSGICGQSIVVDGGLLHPLASPGFQGPSPAHSLTSSSRDNL